ncbi:hypothetical protein BS17DRAFT_742669 [Gyrodon lividus]|nr:hypothetical protein BS17DRAFT_742669 [Gyrodon lividus]
MPVQTRSGAKGGSPKTIKSATPRKGKKVKEGNVLESKQGGEGKQPEVKEEGGRTETKYHPGKKRDIEEASVDEEQEYPTKKQKTEGQGNRSAKYYFHPGRNFDPLPSSTPSLILHAGAIECGHIYFFYRPKVQHEDVHSLDDVKNFHILLVPRPPEFSVHSEEMTLIPEGADVVPASEMKDQPKKRFRLLTIGKKRLPEAEGGHEIFWASVTAVGDDLHMLERGLGEKSYETKTRGGMRHEGPVRLAGRGVYAIVNKKGSVPSSNATHLGYNLSHPSTPGEVQEALGIHTASSFVVQVRNPLAEVSYAQRVGLPANKRANYPEAILANIFERGSRGRHPFGLRFTTCCCIELLDYAGAELLLIAARTGAAGNDKSLGEHRGEGTEVGERESQEPVEDMFRDLAMDKNAFSAEPLKGHWI